MAKLGEGDERWIVQERADGANVHGWHWQEKDALEWSKQRLGELLGGLQVVDGQGGLWIKTTALASCTGEAYVNKRKGKIIPGYELEVKVAWEGEAREGGSAAGGVIAAARGTVHFPYLADENADDDCELRVTAEGGSTADDRMREACAKVGAPLFRAKVAQWVKEMAAGGPGGAGGAPDAPKSEAEAAAAKAKAARVAKEAKEAEERRLKALDASSTRTIELTERFYCRPADIFEALTHPGRVRAFTQSDCTVSAEPGAPFKLFSGNIEGENLEMRPPNKIVQKWRFRNWAEGVYSTVTIDLTEPEAGTTVVKLRQTDVPVADSFGNETVVDTTERGWKEQIFQRIRVVFGFGC